MCLQGGKTPAPVVPTIGVIYLRWRQLGVSLFRPLHGGVQLVCAVTLQPPRENRFGLCARGSLRGAVVFAAFRGICPASEVPGPPPVPSDSRSSRREGGVADDCSLYMGAWVLFSV